MGNLGVQVDAPRRGRRSFAGAFSERNVLRPLQLAATVPAATGLHGIDVYLSTG